MTPRGARGQPDPAGGAARMDGGLLMAANFGAALLAGCRAGAGAGRAGSTIMLECVRSQAERARKERTV